jgi:nitrite reductase (NADH) small subunit
MTTATNELRFPDVEGREIDFDPQYPGAWIPVCGADALFPERGAAALLPGGIQVALFRTHDGEIYVVSNADPFTGAMVMARGIVGDRGGRPTVASPLHKQVFDLGSGQCLDDERVQLVRYPARVEDGTVEVGVP